MGPSPPSGRQASAVHYFHQPPRSPIVPAATPSLAFGKDNSCGSTRKRQRPDSSQQKPWTETPAWAQCPTLIDNSGFGQGSELINERYRLADGFDTPGVRSTSRLEQLTVHENEFRRRLRDDGMDFAMSSGCTPLSGPLARERNGVARVRTASNEREQTTWTSLAFNFLGKAFSFGTTVFRGFYAGGGQGYDVLHSGPVGSDLLQHRREGTSTPIPGSWHDTDAEFLGDFEQDSPHFNHGSPSRPAVKRRQTDRDSWVLVGSPEADGRPSSPKRKISGNGVPRSSLAPPRPSASRASSRRSLAPVSRRTNSHHQTHVAPVQVAAPTQPQSRRASVALTRSPQTRPSSAGLGAAFVSPEAERFAKRQAKQDKAMANIGSRIQEMMRQAQEALGTKYSIEDGHDGMDMEEEGFVDDDW